MSDEPSDYSDEDKFFRYYFLASLGIMSFFNLFKDESILERKKASASKQTT